MIVTFFLSCHTHLCHHVAIKVDARQRYTKTCPIYNVILKVYMHSHKNFKVNFDGIFNFAEQVIDAFFQNILNNITIQNGQRG